MIPGFLTAVLLSQVFPAWRVDEVATGASSCPKPNELEAALAAQLQRDPTPGPAPAWHVSVAVPGGRSGQQEALAVTLRDPAERVRLSRSVPQVDGECGDVADAVAFIVERYLRDLDWQGPGVEGVPPEILSPGGANRGGASTGAVSSQIPGNTVVTNSWRLVVGMGLRQGVAVEPQADLGIERMFETWRAAFVFSAPLATAHLEAGPTSEMVARQVVVSSWAARLDVQRVWQLGALRAAAGLDVLYVLDFAHGEDFDGRVSVPPRSYVAAGMSGILGWQFSRSVAAAVLAFADLPLAVQPMTINDERVAKPRPLQAGGVLLLTFSFFS